MSNNMSGQLNPIARNSIQHGCQACAGGTHVDLNMAAEHRESVESNVNFASFC